MTERYDGDERICHSGRTVSRGSVLDTRHVSVHEKTPQDTTVAQDTIITQDTTAAKYMEICECDVVLQLSRVLSAKPELRSKG